MSKRYRRTTLQAQHSVFREVTFLVLAAVLAGVAIYSAYEPDSALGLVDPVYAQTPTLITKSDTAIVSGTQALDLQVPRAALSNDPQVEATWFDPTNPPTVLNAQVRNSRIGGQVLITWERPEGVDSVTVTRTIAGKKAVVLVEETTNESFVDTELTDGEQVTYSISSHITFEGNVYTSAQPVEVKSIVSDTIAPTPPTQVTVMHMDGEKVFSNTQGLIVTWVNSTDTDIEEVHVYRSTSYGNRGQLLKVLAPTVTEYTDETVLAHETYYYTVVAVDGSGNESSFDYDIPAVGNSTPFEPIGVAENTDDSAE